MKKTDFKKALTSKRNKKLAGVFCLLIALAATLIWLFSNQGMEADTTVAIHGDIEKYVEEIGEVKCKDSTTIYLEGSGVVRHIAVEEGQRVKKGALLLSLDQEQYDLAVQTAEETLRSARTQYEAGEEGYRTALKDYTNTKFLTEEGAVSNWELTQKETALKNAESVRSAYKAELEQAELTLQNQSITLGKQQILAPIDGTILEKNVNLNELSVPGTAAFVIGNKEDLEIESKILAEDSGDIEIGDPAEIIIRSEDAGRIKGTVTKISPTATEEISSLGVKQKKINVTIKPVSSEAGLTIGSETDVKVITETKSRVIIVPAGAVFDYRGESCVFVVNSGKAVLRTVERGIRNDSIAEIIDGLNEGEIVLSSPDNRVEEGMRIKEKAEEKNERNGKDE